MASSATRVVLAVFLVILGGLSVHYALASGAEHHRAWAEAHHMPPPGAVVTAGGWIAIAAGAILLAQAVLVRRRATDPR